MNVEVVVLSVFEPSRLLLTEHADMGYGFQFGQIVSLEHCVEWLLRRGSSGGFGSGSGKSLR